MSQPGCLGPHHSCRRNAGTPISPGKGTDSLSRRWRGAPALRRSRIARLPIRVRLVLQVVRPSCLHRQSVSTARVTLAPARGQGRAGSAGPGPSVPPSRPFAGSAHKPAWAGGRGSTACQRWPGAAGRAWDVRSSRRRPPPSPSRAPGARPSGSTRGLAWVHACQRWPGSSLKPAGAGPTMARPALPGPPRLQFESVGGAGPAS